MILSIDEKEIKEAVVFWLKKTKGIEVKPEDLQPQFETFGEYEDARTSMVGFMFTFESAQLKVK